MWGIVGATIGASWGECLSVCAPVDFARVSTHRNKGLVLTHKSRVL